jgi:hypothetical protein
MLHGADYLAEHKTVDLTIVTSNIGKILKKKTSAMT